MGRSVVDRRARRFIRIITYLVSHLWISKAFTRSYILFASFIGYFFRERERERKLTEKHRRNIIFLHVAFFLGFEEIQKKKVSEVQKNAGEIYKERKNFGKSVKHLPLCIWLLVRKFMIFCKYKNKVSSYTNDFLVTFFMFDS